MKTIRITLINGINLLFLLFICQCAFAQKDKGQDNKRVKSIKIVYEEDGKEILPGMELNLGIIVTFNDGSEHKTKGFLHGDIKWNTIDVKVNGGTFHNGKIILSTDHSCFPEFRAIVTASLTDYPLDSQKIEIPLSFNGSYTADFGGYTRGHAAHHSNGFNGYDLDVLVKTKKDLSSNKMYLLVFIKCLEQPEKNNLLIIDSEKGNVKISSQGSDGSKGTPGSWGGSGFGNGGNGGHGFNGGNGGNINLFIDPSAESFYKKSVSLENAGGHGGEGGHGGHPGAKGGTKGQDGNAGISGKEGNTNTEIQTFELPKISHCQ